MSLHTYLIIYYFYNISCERFLPIPLISPPDSEGKCHAIPMEVATLESERSVASFWLFVITWSSVSSRIFFRSDFPFRLILCALCTRRSRMTSATVGSPICSCQFSSGADGTVNIICSKRLSSSSAGNVQDNPASKARDK